MSLTGIYRAHPGVKRDLVLKRLHFLLTLGAQVAPMSNATAKHQLWKLDEAGKFTPVFFSVFFFAERQSAAKLPRVSARSSISTRQAEIVSAAPLRGFS